MVTRLGGVRAHTGPLSKAWFEGVKAHAGPLNRCGCLAWRRGSLHKAFKQAW